MPKYWENLVARLIFVQSDLSIAVIDRRTNDIVGGDFLFRYLDDVDQSNLEHHDSMRPIVALLDLLESPIRSRLASELRQSESDDLRRSTLLYNFCLFVDVRRLTPVEQVKVCQLIESSVLDVAERNGFGGVVTNNTNPVIQVSISVLRG